MISRVDPHHFSIQDGVAYRLMEPRRMILLPFEMDDPAIIDDLKRTGQNYEYTLDNEIYTPTPATRATIQDAHGNRLGEVDLFHDHLDDEVTKRVVLASATGGCAWATFIKMLHYQRTAPLDTILTVYLESVYRSYPATPREIIAALVDEAEGP